MMRPLCCKRLNLYVVSSAWFPDINKPINKKNAKRRQMLKYKLLRGYRIASKPEDFSQPFVFRKVLSAHPVPKTLKWRIIIVDTFSARAAPEWKSVSYHVEHGYLLVEVCVINKCYCLFWCGGMGLTNVPVFFWVEVGVFNKCDCLLWCGSIDLTNVHDFYGWIRIADLA